jgi:hypothetical protein
MAAKCIFELRRNPEHPDAFVGAMLIAEYMHTIRITHLKK